MKLPLLVTSFLLRREDTAPPNVIDVDLVSSRSAKADLYLSPIEVLLELPICYEHRTDSKPQR